MPNHKKVIPFPSVSWRFFDFLEGQGNPIQQWYDGLSEDGQETFHGLLKLNQKADSPSNWVSSKMLQGEGKKYGIWEWRFFADDRQQRLLGIFSDERKKAIFLIGCYHKQKRYTPDNCLKTAIDRSKRARQQGARFNERKITENY